ncbi:MAG TPA: hypothetical protein DEP43_07910, partial [Ruminococcaceae bacterium]|nr:hypothetical protein [Oscillospiraceae bacterium]
SFIRWSKYPDAKDENLTQVKSLGWKKGILVMALVIAFSLVAGSITMNIPGAESSYLEAFASAIGMVNGVLLLLRYSEQWYAWFITTILYIIMDISAGAYGLLIDDFAMLVNTIYGTIRWFLYVQKEKKMKQAISAQIAAQSEEA